MSACGCVALNEGSKNSLGLDIQPEYSGIMKRVPARTPVSPSLAWSFERERPSSMLLNAIAQGKEDVLRTVLREICYASSISSQEALSRLVAPKQLVHALTFSEENHDGSDDEKSASEEQDYDSEEDAEGEEEEEQEEEAEEDDSEVDSTDRVEGWSGDEEDPYEENSDDMAEIHMTELQGHTKRKRADLQHGRPAKRTRPGVEDFVMRYQVSRNCEQLFDMTDNERESCMTHPDTLDVHEDEFPDDDDPPNGGYTRLDEDWRIASFPESFYWECCEGNANAKGCVKQRHKVDVNILTP